MSQTLCILGSTGTIGVNTLDVVARHRDRFAVRALSGRCNVATMLDQCARFHPQQVVMVEEPAAARLQQCLHQRGLEIEVEAGVAALEKVAREAGEIVVCGIVGAAGLGSTLAAVEAGHRVLVANKEPLVMLGRHLVRVAGENGATLLPLDSEHNAIFQCLPPGGQAVGVSPTRGVRKILLTGSGGPLRTTPIAQLDNITPEQACAHPNWKMGRKTSVDSATMMNKGLELIEACVLFGVPPAMVEIVIHPESVIHSMVEYIDGSVLAQLGAPDMRVPLAHALGWPERIESGAPTLDFSTIAGFNFAPPDPERFPALALARAAAERGGTMPAILNAANEVAVQQFLDRAIPFPRIVDCVEEVMAAARVEDVVTMATVLAADRWARQECTARLGACRAEGN